MFDGIVDKLTNPQAVIASLTAVAVFATVLIMAKPLLARDILKGRMKSVATERERIRARERERLVSSKRDNGKKSLRQSGSNSQSFMSDIVKKFNLRQLFDDGSLQLKLAQAGYRGPRPIIIFLFARLCLPFIFFALALFYMFTLKLLPEQALPVRIGLCAAVAYVGFLMPGILVSNKKVKRQQSIQRAFPDALDMMLICVESGMSVEAAFKRVAQEVGTNSPPLAEELALTTAELSFLQKRTDAYENLAKRTGLDGVKACALALTQAEKVGTPVGAALRVMAQENRDLRMNAAEHKAASLPPKLTVPMIIFFLPVLLMVIIGPAIIQLIENGAL
ncbi:MAG: type II secretion system F family protein [Rhizobiales bacterium]|nr:type II secretion system F family protein [Hyphomicrobiales bacterium]